MRRSTYLLFPSAVIVLAVGLWPFANRLYGEYQRDAQVRERASLVAQERAAQKANLLTNKQSVLDEAKSLQASGRHADVMKLAARYRLADDADLHAIFVRSAEQVSTQQLLDRMEQLVAKSCTGIQAMQTASTVLSTLFPEVTQASSAGWTSERVDPKSLLPQIRDRLKDWAKPPATDAKSMDNLAKAQSAHTPRLLQPIYQSLLTASDPSALICAWRIKGSWPANERPQAAVKPFDILIWYAPSATERTLEHDVLSLKI